VVLSHVSRTGDAHAEQPPGKVGVRRLLGRHAFGFYSFNMTLPQFPLIVEVVLRRGGGLSIDPGGQAAAASILTALGFPGYDVRSRPQARDGR
jgi:hypothetical protein